MPRSANDFSRKQIAYFALVLWAHGNRERHAVTLGPDQAMPSSAEQLR
jgi:hypothetical protein